MTTLARQHIRLIPESSVYPYIHVYRRAVQEVPGYEAMQVDAYVLFTKHYALVCDTLLCPQDMDALLSHLQQELAERQVLVFNSHADWDHAWGNSYFTGSHRVPIIAHEECATRLRSEEERVTLADFQHRSTLFETVTLTPPLITFKEALSIHDHDLKIELLSAPGHTRDHCVIWLPELRYLLAFDAVEYPLPIIENASSVPTMQATLQRLRALQPAKIFCSHGEQTSPDLLQHNLTYIQRLEARCRNYLSMHHPTAEQLEQGSILLHYTLDDVLHEQGEVSIAVDRPFYSWAHDHNIRCILQWLMHQEEADQESS